MDVLMVNTSKEIYTSPSIEDAQDNIMSDIGNSSKKAIDTITTIVTSTQSKCDSHIAKMDNTKATILSDEKSKYEAMIQSLTDHRDGAITDFAAFQTKLKGETKATFAKIIVDNSIKLSNDLDIMVIYHDARLRAIADDIKQEIKTTLFLNLQDEKLRIKT